MVVHVTQPNDPRTEVLGLVFGLESQVFLEEPQLGSNAVQVPEV